MLRNLSIKIKVLFERVEYLLMVILREKGIQWLK